MGADARAPHTAHPSGSAGVAVHGRKAVGVPENDRGAAKQRVIYRDAHTGHLHRPQHADHARHSLRDTQRLQRTLCGRWQCRSRWLRRFLLDGKERGAGTESHVWTLSRTQPSTLVKERHLTVGHAWSGCGPMDTDLAARAGPASPAAATAGREPPAQPPWPLHARGPRPGSAVHQRQCRYDDRPARRCGGRPLPDGARVPLTPAGAR